ncbi:unnamed protein product [Hydatigera taeniaeformis]|uniref:TF-B3 domain-containing protein n=1 Tax=Hydatigena taeniaeformis TaxID=6205 RepID=A0A0R3X5I4_HYDTA|nr:unnamed protein product [Hydatigera taeniaeformis]
MSRSCGAGFRHWRERKKSLTPWLIGLRNPELVRELVDVIPFIYLCCKLSVCEQSWAAQPENPKAVVVKTSDFLRLCDGQFWIELLLDGSIKERLVCGWDCFVAHANEVKFVKETHCLAEAFGSIPCIMTCKEDLLVQPSASYECFDLVTYYSLVYSLSDTLDFRDYSSGGDNEMNGPSSTHSCGNASVTCAMEEKQLNTGNGADVGRQDVFQTVDQWVPTQNASDESLAGFAEVETHGCMDFSCAHENALILIGASAQSTGAPQRGKDVSGNRTLTNNDALGAEGDLSYLLRISPTPPVKAISNSDIPLFSGDTPPLLNSSNPGNPRDVNSSRLCLLGNLVNVPAVDRSNDRVS